MQIIVAKLIYTQKGVGYPMTKSFGKIMKNTLKKGSKKAKKGASQLSEQLFGKKRLMLKHTYDSTVSLYRKDNAAKPLYSVTAKGEYKSPLLRFMIITLCTLAGVILLGFAIKAIKDKRRRKKEAALYDFDYEYFDPDEDLPF